MQSRSRTVVDKSIEAMLAAIEIYNKPNFSYREECFAILAINSWELLLKARLLQLSDNKMSSILLYQRRKKADGELSIKLYRVKNRAGNYLSIGLFPSIDRLRDDFGDSFDSSVRKNLELLCEIRDNAIHFFNKGSNIAKLTQELGTANLRNYLLLIARWFGVDMSKYNFFLMPLAFVKEEVDIHLVSLNADERRVIEFLKAAKEEKVDSDESEFNVVLTLDIRFSKTKSSEGAQVRVTNDPNAPTVRLAEEDIREKYPWDYSILTTRLRKRYKDFSANQRYHELRRALEDDDRFCNTRYLDPVAKSGTLKRFYNPNIVREFDGHYERNS